MALSLLSGAATAYADAAPAAEQFAAAAVTIKLEANHVKVDNPTDTAAEVAVFSITGTTIKHTSVQPGETLEIELPSGFYIVKAGKATQRVAVR